MSWTSFRSRPSRCIAPPSAQKSFCTSTIRIAACCGRTLSARVLSMGMPSRFEDHGVDLERFDHLVLDRDLEIGLQARQIELGRVHRKRYVFDDLGLHAGE